MNLLTKYINNVFFKKNAPSIFEKAYLNINNSKSYKDLCIELHQVNFPCWNTLSSTQRLFLESELSNITLKSLIDVGSGNGELTKYLCSKFMCTGTGIDFAQLPSQTKNVKFIKAEFLKENIKENYSALISIDSFYMINNYKKYLKKMKALIEPGGKAIILFSLTMKSFNESNIPKALKSLNLSYTLKDFTADDLEFWNKSQEILDQFNDRFVDEGQFNLWNIKKKETDKNVQLHKSNNISRLALVIDRG